MPLDRIAAANPPEGYVSTGVFQRAVLDGRLVEIELVELAYVAARRAAYPPIGHQLDALYKARMGDETELAAIDAEIKAVKDAHPKPAA